MLWTRSKSGTWACICKALVMLSLSSDLYFDLFFYRCKNAVVFIWLIDFLDAHVIILGENSFTVARCRITMNPKIPLTKQIHVYRQMVGWLFPVGPRTQSVNLPWWRYVVMRWGPLFVQHIITCSKWPKGSWPADLQQLLLGKYAVSLERLFVIPAGLTQPQSFVQLALSFRVKSPHCFFFLFNAFQFSLWLRLTVRNMNMLLRRGFTYQNRLKIKDSCKLAKVWRGIFNSLNDYLVPRLSKGTIIQSDRWYYLCNSKNLDWLIQFKTLCTSTKMS